MALQSEILTFIAIYMKIFAKNITQLLFRITLSVMLSCNFWMVFAANDYPTGYYDAIAVKIVKCYPNPAVSFVNFDVDFNQVNKGNSIQVYSFSGKKLFESQILAVRTTLTFNENYFRGIYVYQLKDKTGRIIETGNFQVVK